MLHIALKGPPMSKGNKKHGNKEAKKPKKVTEKVIATADFNKGKSSPIFGAKEVK
jgi:hypothetical protein